MYLCSLNQNPKIIARQKEPVCPWISNRPAKVLKNYLKTNKLSEWSPNIWRSNLVLPSGRRAHFLTESLWWEQGLGPQGELRTHSCSFTWAPFNYISISECDKQEKRKTTATTSSKQTQEKTHTTVKLWVISWWLTLWDQTGILFV